MCGGSGRPPGRSFARDQSAKRGREEMRAHEEVLSSVARVCRLSFGLFALNVVFPLSLSWDSRDLIICI